MKGLHVSRAATIWNWKTKDNQGSLAEPHGQPGEKGINGGTCLQGTSLGEKGLI